MLCDCVSAITDLTQRKLNHCSYVTHIITRPVSDDGRVTLPEKTFIIIKHEANKHTIMAVSDLYVIFMIFCLFLEKYSEFT